MKTMYGRQFATMAGMILLSFLMLGASFATLSYQYAIQEKQDSMGRSANIIAAYTSEYINANGQYSWQDMGFQGQLSVLALATDTHVMVSTAQGTVVYATDGANELLELESRSIPTQIVSEVVGGSFVGATTLGGMYERPRYLVALPIQSGATLQGLVLVSCEASEISSMWQDISSLFLITATAVILIAAIISSVTSKYSLDIKEMLNILNKKSGVLGVSGVSSDFRDLGEAGEKGNTRAALAVDMFNYGVKKYIGAYAAAMGGVDAIIFTAGVGENSADQRMAIASGLEFMGVKMDAEANNTRGKETVISAADSQVKVLLIPTNEELMIALDTAALA